MAELLLKGLHKIYETGKGIHVLKDVNLDIQDGEFVVFVGPSGCGKSTLLRMIAGLEDISAGELWIGGRLVNDMTPPERGIGMVFQSYALYPHMTVYENMAFGLKLARTARDTVDERVREVAAILQLEPLLERKPKALSGGQRQRVAIGRAMVRRPDVFLLDEPLSNLDAALRVRMRIEIAKLHQQLRSTMIYVTHDQVEAMTLADKIVVLNGGCVEQVGSPLTLYHNPVNTFVAGFIGSPKMNFLPISWLEEGSARALQLPDGTRVAAPSGWRSPLAREGLSLGIRPEHLTLGQEGDFSVSGQVQVVEHLGNVSLVYMMTPQSDEPLVFSVAGADVPAEGSSVTVSAVLKHLHGFDQDGLALASGAGAG